MQAAGIESTLVQYLQLQNGVSRVELATALSVAPSTIGIHVDRLMSRGYLKEEVLETGSAGRPPKLVQVNPEAGQFIGIDLDAREIYGVSVDFSQRLLRDRTASVLSSVSAEEVLNEVDRVIDDVRDRHRPLLGVGFALPGAVDSVNGTGVHYQYIRGWKDLKIAERYSQRLQVPISIENNIRTMALAEQRFGMARHVDNVLCIGIRSGIGSGILIKGHLFRGPAGMAGEIGGWPIELKDGQITTLEKVASLRTLLTDLAAAVRAGRPTCLKLVRNQLTRESLFAAIEAGDSLTCHKLHQAAKSVGIAVAQMTLLLNPQKIVICGPLAAATDAFVTPLRETLENSLPSHLSHTPEVTASELGDLVGAFGAAALIARQWQPT